ncbi:MAG TPA: type II secretion system F family protein [Acidimicrobiales bacterium]|nr:type II secretion system F family protein [Acidimicrobiales bacterium]
MTTTFDYKVRDQRGNLVEGTLEADSIPIVVTRLREMGYLPVSVAPAKGKGLKTEIIIPGLSDRIKPKEVAVFTRQFATMVDSGLTISRSLAVLANQVENKHFATILRAIHDDVDAGVSLSTALAKHPKVFDDLYVAMVAAGEIGGSIDMVLKNISVTLEKQVELNRKVRGAMTYPIVVVSVIAVILTVMLTVIVPIFKKLFASLGGKLPFPTRVLITISNTIASWRVGLVILVVGVGTFLFVRWIKTENGKRAWDRFKMRPPVFGPVTHKAAMSRFAATLSSLLSAGVPAMEALDITAAAAGNSIVADAVMEVKARVREGMSFAEPMGRLEVFSPLMVQMVEVGEQTGALDEMLQRVSDFYIGEVDQTVDNLTSILEPFLVVIMGVVIGAIIICLYLPMFDYIKLVH